MKKIFVLVLFGMFATVAWAQPVTDIKEVGTVMSDDPIGNFAMTYTQELTDENQSFSPFNFSKWFKPLSALTP